MEVEQAQGQEHSADEALNVDSQTETEQQEPQITDLDKLEKFKWGGNEYSPKDLTNLVMMRSDYTRKTQELAKERQFVESFASDISFLKDNPSQISKFKEIYPEKYHAYADMVLKNMGIEQKQPDPYDDRISKMESFMSEYQKEKYDAEVKAQEAFIDSELSKATSKYKDLLNHPTIEERFKTDVINLAERALNDGIKLDSKTWGKISDAVASNLKEVFGAKRADIIGSQSRANKMARESAPGGGIVGQPPRKFKSIRDATEQFLKDEGY